MSVNKFTILKLVTLQLILIIQLSSCQRMQTEKYEWIPTIGAPEIYPIKIIRGEFITKNEIGPDLPRCDFVGAGWGDSGCVMAVGPDKKGLPDSLSITWLSFAEDKFYDGKFSLPKQIISDLFKKGYVDRYSGKQRTYDYLTLGMTPGGTVVLWLSGGNKQIEVSQFKAKEIKLTVKDLGPDFEYMFKPGFVKETYERNMSPELREQFKKDGIQYNLAEKWLKRYNLNFTVNSDKVKFYQLMPFYLNSEQEQIFDSALVNDTAQQRAVPEKINVEWFDQKGRKMITEIVFDQNEIQAAFGRIPQGGKGELHFEVDPNEYTVAVTLKTDGKSIKIEKQKAKTQHDANYSPE